VTSLNVLPSLPHRISLLSSTRADASFFLYRLVLFLLVGIWRGRVALLVGLRARPVSGSLHSIDTDRQDDEIVREPKSPRREAKKIPKFRSEHQRNLRPYFFGATVAADRATNQPHWLNIEPNELVGIHKTTLFRAVTFPDSSIHCPELLLSVTTVDESLPITNQPRPLSSRQHQ
jgi:hypothetical protein